MREGDGHLLYAPVRAVPEVVRREDGAVLGQVRVEVAGVQLRGGVSAVKQLLFDPAGGDLFGVHGARKKTGQGDGGEAGE